MEDPNYTATFSTTGQYSTLPLKNVTSTTYLSGDTAAYQGWYYNLSTNSLVGSGNITMSNVVGEKMISDPTVFGGDVYFVTYVPAQGTATACGQAGSAFLYKLGYTSSAADWCTTSTSGVVTCPAGILSTSQRALYIGQGIGSSVLMSYSPGYGSADIYLTTSGGAGNGTQSKLAGFGNTTSSFSNILYWKDKRLQQ
jgi:hypothetical protein